MYSAIIQYLTGKIESLNAISKVYGLGNIVSYNSEEYPSVVSNGENVHVNFDLFKSLSFILKNGNVSRSTDEHPFLANAEKVTQVYPLRLIIYSQNTENENCESLSQQIADYISAQLSGYQALFVSELALDGCKITVTSKNTNKYDVWSELYSTEHRLKEADVLISIDFEFEVSGDETCFTTAPCETSEFSFDFGRTTFCEKVENCLGISESGSETKYLNEQGYFVTIETTSTFSSSFVFTGTNSGISGYELMVPLADYVEGAIQSITKSVGTSPVLLEEFVTSAGDLDGVKLLHGFFTSHYETQKSSGGQSYFTYFELYKRTSGGTETLIATSDNSTETGSNSVVQQTVTALLGAEISLGATDLLVIKIYAQTLSGTHNITLFWDNGTDAHLDLPTSPLSYVPENVSNKSDSYTVSSSTTYASTKAVVDGVASAKSYADGLVVGLWDDRGSFDASGGAYPVAGGSGTGGAILKGDIWVISVAGTLPTGQVVEAGDTIRALIDLPGNTQANWAIQQNNIGYVAENSANKTSTITGNESSTTLYSNVNGMVDWVKQGMTALLSSLSLTKATPVDADSLLLNDSADSNKLKLITFSNVWEWIKSKADSRYRSTLHCKGTAPNTTTAATEVVMEVHAIDANTLNIYDVLNIMAGVRMERSAGTYTLRIGISSSAQTIGNAPSSGTTIGVFGGTATRNGYLIRNWKITNSTTLDLVSQNTESRDNNVLSNSGTVASTVTIDRTNTIYLYVSMQMGTAGDVGTLKDFSIVRTKAT